LDVSRLDSINAPARAMLASMKTALRDVGKAGFLVDPDAVIGAEQLADSATFANLDDAVAAARRWMRDGSAVDRPRK